MLSLREIRVPDVVTEELVLHGMYCPELVGMKAQATMPLPCAEGLQFMLLFLAAPPAQVETQETSCCQLLLACMCRSVCVPAHQHIISKGEGTGQHNIQICYHH